jgi:hypothetical protein
MWGQRYVYGLLALVAVLWCGGIALRWHYQRIEPVLAYASSGPWASPVPVGDCREHDFVAVEQRQASAGDRYQLRLCLRPIVEGASFHIDDDGKITPLPVEHRYTFPLPDIDGVAQALVPPEDERLHRYAAELLHKLRPGADDEARMHDATAQAGHVLLVGNMRLLLGGMAGLALAAWLAGRLSRG